MGETQSEITIPKDNDIELQFKLALIKFSEFVKKFNLELHPYSDHTWIKFRCLSSTAQKSSFEKFLIYSSLCLSADESGADLTDDRALTWWALRQFKLRPCSDFFDKVTEEDVVELYNAEGIQIYRNWAFFEISGYSIGDLFVYSWDELYSRDSSVANLMNARVGLILTGSVRETLPWQVPGHKIVESISDQRNISEMNLKYISPVFDSSGAVAGAFSVCAVKRIGKQLAPFEENASPKAPFLTIV